MRKIRTRGSRIEVLLKKQRGRIGPWWVDKEGTLGHNCMARINPNFEDTPEWFGACVKQLNPTNGFIEMFCTNCGDVCEDGVQAMAKFREFGHAIGKDFK